MKQYLEIIRFVNSVMLKAACVKGRAAGIMVQNETAWLYFIAINIAHLTRIRSFTTPHMSQSDELNISAKSKYRNASNCAKLIHI